MKPDVSVNRPIGGVGVGLEVKNRRLAKKPCFNIIILCIPNFCMGKGKKVPPFKTWLEMSPTVRAETCNTTWMNERACDIFRRQYFFLHLCLVQDHTQVSVLQGTSLTVIQMCT